jgi:hypothetical protein
VLVRSNFIVYWINIVISSYDMKDKNDSPRTYSKENSFCGISKVGLDPG